MVAVPDVYQQGVKIVLRVFLFLTSVACLDFLSCQCFFVFLGGCKGLFVDVFLRRLQFLMIPTSSQNSSAF